MMRNKINYFLYPSVVDKRVINNEYDQEPTLVENLWRFGKFYKLSVF
jgi:hypothetical protein